MFHLKSAGDYVYLNAGGAIAMDGVDDAEEFQKVKVRNFFLSY